MSKETATSDELNKDNKNVTSNEDRAPINSADEKQQPVEESSTEQEKNDAEINLPDESETLAEIQEPFPKANEEGIALSEAAEEQDIEEHPAIDADVNETTEADNQPAMLTTNTEVEAGNTTSPSPEAVEENKIEKEETTDLSAAENVESIESEQIADQKGGSEVVEQTAPILPETTDDKSTDVVNQATIPTENTGIEPEKESDPVSPSSEEAIEAIADDKEDKEQTTDSSAAENVESSEKKEIADPKSESEEHNAPIQEETKAEAEKQTVDEVVEVESHPEQGNDLINADYAQYSKEELVKTIETLSKIDDFKLVDEVLKLINPFFLTKKNTERQEALEKFTADGGDKDDFAYKNSLDQRYDANYKLIKDRKTKYYGDLGKQKLDNYEKASHLLEKLRELVDGEESNSSISAVKEIQTEWKSIGQVPPQHVRNLWASYNALMDRFYDHRSIYFELKELDRRKNLGAKEALISRAEKLEGVENLKDAIRELNDLHNEYKHIGPVPKANQESMWQRFKAASDKVYARRKTYYEGLKHELDANFELKAKLRDEVQPFVAFNSDRIVEWNNQTKEILEIQKKWEAIGGLPKERAHEVNKPFWSAFKAFFNHKNAFFKNLESQREGNMQLKEGLIEKANTIKDSEDWNQAANDLKKLQQDWKNIGPVPEKHRNEIYQRFKAACDHFFDRRRNRFKEVEKEYEVNLKKKEEICDQILKLAEGGSGDIGQLEELQEAWNNIGFVPKNAIRSSQAKFAEVVDLYISKSSLTEDDKAKLKITTKLTSLKGTPNANRKLNKKEFTLRKQITNLENDITLWKNNLEFFANSKNADQVRLEFDKKIEDANAQLEALKEQLRIIKNI